MQFVVIQNIARVFQAIAVGGWYVFVLFSSCALNRMMATNPASGIFDKGGIKQL